MTERGTTDEWVELAATWRLTNTEASVDVEAMAREIAASRRRLVMSLVADLFITCVFLVGSAWAVIRAPGPLSYFVAADVALLSVVMWMFALWNQRGLWQLSTKTTEAFLEAARVRCVRRIRAADFTLGVVLCQLIIVYSWRLQHRASTLPQRPIAAALVVAWMTAVAYVAWATRERIRAKRELAHLNTIRVEPSFEGESAS